MRMYDIIETKKRGGELTADEISEMIKEYTAGEIPDYQMSAFLMAVCFRGMSDAEMFALTDAMLHSGDTVDLSAFGNKSVDKHSTGGVGDKTTLIIAPIAAAAGAVVAKMSGRGLGHTGGTVDKLEAFPGFKTALSPADFEAQVKELGICVIGQSASLAAADKKLYALRDVTATVDSVPLIASSIMSKKLAAGTSSIVLDVKCGAGAFMHTPEDAEKLASAMVRIGRAYGRGMSALITDMNMPLGLAVGNSLEIAEAVEVLKGRGPDDLREIALALSSRMIKNSLGISLEQAKSKALEALDSGRAFDVFVKWIGAQGGDAKYAEDPELFGMAKYKKEIKAEQSGFVSIENAELIGTAAMTLGAGRRVSTDVIDPRAGIILAAKTADEVKRGDLIATLYTEREETLADAERIFRNGVKVTENRPTAPALIYKIIE